MEELWTYEQWFEKYNDPRYWNPDPKDLDKFYAQDEQLSDTHWTQAMLFDATRYAQYQHEKNSEYAKTHNIDYGEPPPYPDFRPGSGYVSPYVHSGGLAGEPFTVEPLPIEPPKPVEELDRPGFRKIKTPIKGQYFWKRIGDDESISSLTVADLKSIIREALEAK